MTYFERHAQRTPQWRSVRRNGRTDTGTVVIHTYEAPAGRSWQAGAEWLTRRTDYGSYHWLSDALGNQGHLAPWSGETFHERHSNNWTVGISMMAYAAQWRNITATHRRNLVNGAALGAHRYSRWRVGTGRAPVPARRISRSQAMAGVAGFISHGEMDPGRRSDPGAHFPWGDFMTEYRRLESGTTTTDPLEEIMSWYNSKAEFEKAMFDNVMRYTNPKVTGGSKQVYTLLRHAADDERIVRAVGRLIDASEDKILAALETLHEGEPQDEDPQVA